MERTIKILLVDDHAMVREGLRHILGQHPGFMVAGEADAGPAALELTRALKPTVVVMDLHLRGASGIEVSRQMLQEFPQIKIVMLSGDFNPALVSEALQAGIAAYVIKDDAGSELVRAIQTVLDHRTYLCPDVASAVLGDYMSTLAGKSIPASKPSLSERERQLLRVVAEGKRNKEIAEVLGVTVKSVETYRSRLMKKLGCATGGELIRYAIREGIAKP